jgi:hypothetical protein
MGISAARASASMPKVKRQASAWRTERRQHNVSPPLIKEREVIRFCYFSATLLVVALQCGPSMGTEACFGQPDKAKVISSNCVCPAGTTKELYIPFATPEEGIDDPKFYGMTIYLCNGSSHSTSTPSSRSSERSSPSKPDDASQCISSWKKPMQNGYIEWGIKNSCDAAISFDYDDCNPDEDLQVVCKATSATVGGHREFSNSNYHNPARARNYR